MTALPSYCRRMLFTAALAVAAASVTLLALGGGQNTATPAEAGPVFGFVITVNTDTDEDTPAGSLCSLREAIVAASINMPYNDCSTGGAAVADQITFNIGSGTPVINIASNLPLIAGPVIINGNSGGATRVELRGPGSGNLSGLVLDTMAAGSQINRLVINGYPGGSAISVGAANVSLTGNYIGTDATGTSSSLNTQIGINVTGAGVHIGGSNGTTPGGACTGDCNLLSGTTFNAIRVLSPAVNALIEGNFVGTDATGTVVIGNGTGMEIRSAGSVVGGQTSSRRNVVSGNTSNGIYVNGADNTVIRGNFIGTDTTGTIALGNDGNGIGDGGTNTKIGGTNGWSPGGSCTDDCNLISGNLYGVVVGAINSGPTTIQGNMIGTDFTGTAAIGNEIGFNIQGPYHLGGSSPGDGNLVSGNDQCGVETLGATGVIEGNYVGVDTTGMASLPNASEGRFPVSCGVWINTDEVGAVVGGTSSGSRNVIADANALQISSSNSVSVLGNYIGTGADGETPVGPETDFAGVNIDASIGAQIGGTQSGEANVITNHRNGIFIGSGNGDAYNIVIRGNSIHSNDAEGIALVDDDGPQPNQPANLGIQPPVITALGSIHGTACAGCVIDIYSDDEDEGRIYEGSTTANGNGDWTFDEPLTGPFVTATATDPAKGTSEFSSPFDPTPPTPTPSPSPSPTPGPELIQGDINCDDAIDNDDFAFLMEYAAGLDDGTQPAPCPDLDEAVPASNNTHPWGDVNCDDDVNTLDALYVLAHKAGIDLEQPQGCTAIGSPLTAH